MATIQLKQNFTVTQNVLKSLIGSFGNGEFGSAVAQMTFYRAIRVMFGV